MHQHEENYTHDYVRIDGQRLHCVIAGAGKPVLLIPGWPQNWYAWRHVMTALAAIANKNLRDAVLPLMEKTCIACP